MLRQLLRSRGLMSILCSIVVAIVALAGAFILLKPLEPHISYCATMPDSVGLYVGNDVTSRGIKVGKVTDIRPVGAQVRVDFDVQATHPLRGSVTAATVSDTIVADRRLAVDGGKGPDWSPDVCIAKTATPKSITETLDALTALAAQINGADEPFQNNSLGSAVRELDSATSGIGPKINAMTNQLAAALDSPEAAASDIGSLIDNLSSLSQSIADGWGGLRQMLSGLAPVLDLVNNVWDQVVKVVNSIVVILPWFNDVTSKYGGPIMDLLEQAVPALDLIAANVGTLHRLIDMIPVFSDAFRANTDAESGRVTMAYQPPRVALSHQDASRVCSAVAASGCGTTEDGLVAVDLSALVFRLTGAS